MQVNTEILAVFNNALESIRSLSSIIESKVQTMDERGKKVYWLTAKDTLGAHYQVGFADHPKFSQEYRDTAVIELRYSLDKWIEDVKYEIREFNLVD